MSKITESIEFLLDQSDLSMAVAQKPEVSLIPYMRSRDSFYLLVSFVLTPSDETIARALRLCEHVVLVILKSGLVADLPGLEVVPCDLMNGCVRKLFRLSLRPNAFQRAEMGFSLELLDDVPFPGATCGWYVTKPKAGAGSE